MSRPAAAGPDALKVLAFSFGAAVVIATGALLVLRSVRSQPAEPVAAAAPEAVPAPAPAPIPSAAPAAAPAPETGGDRMLVVGESAAAAPAPAHAPAAPSAGPAPVAGKRAWVKHISGSLPPVDVRSR